MPSKVKTSRPSQEVPAMLASNYLALLRQTEGRHPNGKKYTKLEFGKNKVAAPVRIIPDVSWPALERRLSPERLQTARKLSRLALVTRRIPTEGLRALEAGKAMATPIETVSDETKAAATLEVLTLNQVARYGLYVALHTAESDEVRIAPLSRLAVGRLDNSPFPVTPFFVLQDQDGRERAMPPDIRDAVLLGPTRAQNY